MSKHLRKIRDQLNKAKKEGGDILSFLKNIFGESGERAVVFSSRFRELIDLILDNIEDLEGNRETVHYLYKLASQMGYEGIMYLTAQIADRVPYEELQYNLKSYIDETVKEIIISKVDEMLNGELWERKALAIILPSLKKNLPRSRIFNIVQRLLIDDSIEVRGATLKALGDMIDVLGSKWILATLTNIFSHEEPLRYGWFLLTGFSTLYKLYFSMFEGREEILHLIKRVLDADPEVVNKLLKFAQRTYHDDEAAATLWIISIYPQYFNAVDAIKATVNIINRHGEKVLMEAASAIEKKIWDLKGKEFRIIYGIIKHPNHKVRECIALALSKMLSSGYEKAIKPLLRLAMDKRSSIRRIACSAIMEKLGEFEEDDYVIAIRTLIKSRWAMAVETALTSLMERGDILSQEDFKRIILTASKDPRTSVMRPLIELLQMRWKEIGIDMFHKALTRILNNLRDRKELIEMTENLIKFISQQLNDKKKDELRKVIKKSDLPLMLKKRFLRLVS